MTELRCAARASTFAQRPRPTEANLTLSFISCPSLGPRRGIIVTFERPCITDGCFHGSAEVGIGIQSSLTYLPGTLDSSRLAHGSAEVGIGIQSGAQDRSRCWRFFRDGPLVRILHTGDWHVGKGIAGT